MNYNPETNQFEITVKLEGPIAETACRAVRDIRSDIDVIMARDPAARSRLEVLC